MADESQTFWITNWKPIWPALSEFRVVTCELEIEIHIWCAFGC